MPDFDECRVEDGTLLGIDEEGPNFGFCSGGHDIA